MFSERLWEVRAGNVMSAHLYIVCICYFDYLCAIIEIRQWTYCVWCFAAREDYLNSEYNQLYKAEFVLERW